eukprot:scaffold101704_cov51-Phaeocystis_antarctica.AAC.1
MPGPLDGSPRWLDRADSPKWLPERLSALAVLGPRLTDDETQRLQPCVVWEANAVHWRLQPDTPTLQPYVCPQWRKFDEDGGAPRRGAAESTPRVVAAKAEEARLPLPDAHAHDGPPTVTGLPPSPAAAHAHALAPGDGAPGDGAPGRFLGWLGS